jgi:tRNA (guanine-N7-)-methyltransferase
MGKAIALMAERNPLCGYIGIEVHTPGVARLLWEIENRGLRNIRIIHGDAVCAVRDMLPAGAAAAFHIFFPDPWPKKRHHKRRLLSAEFLRLLAERLTDGGYLYIVTDWEDYAFQVEDALARIPELRRITQREGLVPWRPETAFEKKARAAGRKITEIFCLRTKIV